MRKLLTTVSLAFAVASAPAVMADATKGKLNSYEKLEDVFKGFKPHETLLVLDNDDTISTMPCVDEKNCQYLGGAAWFDWQDHLIEKDDPNRVAKDFGELLQISALIFNVSNMQYTEQRLPEKLQALTKSGVRLLVETARGTVNVNATSRQFRNLKIDGSKYKNFKEFVLANGLAFDGAKSLPSPVKPCSINGSRPVTFQQGVMYLAGQNKGIMLQCLLEQYALQADINMPIKNIVFIDDTPKNVENVYKAFKGSDAYNVRAFHYTAFDKHKKALTEGPRSEELQSKANERWEAIKTTLGDQLLMPAMPK